MLNRIHRPTPHASAPLSESGRPALNPHRFASFFVPLCASLWPIKNVFFPRLLLTLTFSLGALCGRSEAKPQAEPEPIAPNDSSGFEGSVQRIDPMDTTGLDRGLATVLRNFYRKNFTSEENWEQIESIRFDGILTLPEGQIRFTAFKKKPDYCKVVIYAPNGGRIVMAYDGQDAWQLNTLQQPPAASPEKTPLLDKEGWLGEAETGWSPQPPALQMEGQTPSVRPAPSSPEPHQSSFINHHSSIMPPQEAKNFIRDATTGGHLLYPGIEGKKIELIGTTTDLGERLYDLQITLPDGQQVRSLLDMTTFAEVRQITTNNLNGDQQVTTHADFREIDGLTIPFTSTLTIDGQQIHQSRMTRVQTNLGVMPWMFSRPSGAYIPGELPNEDNITPSFTSPPQVKTPLLSKEGWRGAAETGWSESAFNLDSPTSAFHVTPSQSEGGDIDPDILTPEETQVLLKDLEADN